MQKCFTSIFMDKKGYHFSQYNIEVHMQDETVSET